MKSRRAVSEIVSALIIIAVVASGLGLYVTLSQQRILGETQSVKDAMESSESRLTEIIEQIVILKNNTGVREVSVFVYNYGLKNVTITDVFVNGTKPMKDNENIPDGFVVRTLTKANLDNVIPSGMASELVLNFTNYQSGLKHIDRVVIHTDSNNLIEIRNGTN
ncbi:MAG: hypothetical protein ACT4NT_04465 [Nitrososphaerota archaeon]